MWQELLDSAAMLRGAVLAAVVATATAGARDAWQASLQANKRDRPPPRSPIWDKSFRCVINNQKSSTNAYAVLGPISEERKYSKWVYPILALKAALHKRGSRADVLALLALEEDKEHHRMLPQEEAMLRKLGCGIDTFPNLEYAGSTLCGNQLSAVRRRHQAASQPRGSRRIDATFDFHTGFTWVTTSLGPAAHGVPPNTSARRGRLATGGHGRAVRFT